ncbi:UNVERIFIED_CONTAM: hypothetical protein FKN15_026887 [Acipenser sinensis]
MSELNQGLPIIKLLPVRSLNSYDKEGIQTYQSKHYVYVSKQRVICEALEDDDISTTSDDLTISPMRTKTKISEQGNQKLMQEHAKLSFIPSVAIEGGKHWTDDEVRALLHIWSDSNIQTKLEGAVRNKSIFEEIANKLQKFGIDRDWK